MHATKIFFSAVLLSIQVDVAYSTPITATELQRRVDCDNVSKYTIQYFMSKKIWVPGPSTCLFYTAYLSETAKKYSHSGGACLTTIWGSDMWSCDHYYGDINDEKNRLRCIFKDDRTREQYFARMSEAMAISCDNFTTVMTNDPKKVPQDGIWGRVEKPALQRMGNPGGQVDTIIAIDTSGGKVETIWTRPGTRGRCEMAETSVVEMRGDKDFDRCYTPKQIQEWFGESVRW